MRVTFLAFDRGLASARYRQHIPIRALEGLGVDIGPQGDVLVCSKHGWDEKLAEGYKRIVFDVCDDHFGTGNDSFYRKMIDRADAVVCNSAAMQWRIWQQTGKASRVIPDPYEFDEKEPSWGDGLVWFGHESNLRDLWREVPSLQGYKMSVVSKPVAEGITEWSTGAVIDALDKAAVCILPTGRSPCKSANRLIEAIRRGKFVVANPLPAYEEFSGLVWVGDIREGVDWAHHNREEALQRVLKAQAYIRSRYSPERIGKLWKAILDGFA